MQHGGSKPEFWANRITRWFAWISGGFLLFGCAGLITLDVVTRYFLNRTVFESFELSGYALAASVALGMAYTISARSNIRIDLVSSRLPLRARIALDFVAHLGLTLLALVIAWYATQTWLQSQKLEAKSISILQVPLVVPQGIWLFGLCWFALFACLVAGRAAASLLRRDLAAVQSLIGPATLQEEIEQAGHPAGERP